MKVRYNVKYHQMLYTQVTKILQKLNSMITYRLKNNNLKKKQAEDQQKYSHFPTKCLSMPQETIKRQILLLSHWQKQKLSNNLN